MNMEVDLKYVLFFTVLIVRASIHVYMHEDSKICLGDALSSFNSLRPSDAYMCQ